MRVAVNLLPVRPDGSAGGAAANARRLLDELIANPDGLEYVLLASPSNAGLFAYDSPVARTVVLPDAVADGALGPVPDDRPPGRLGSLWARVKARAQGTPLLRGTIAMRAARKIRSIHGRWLSTASAAGAWPGGPRPPPPAAVETPLAPHGVDVLFCPLSAVEPFDPDVPAVAAINDLQHEVYPQFFTAAELAHRRAFYRRTFRQATALVAISDATRSHVIRCGVPPERVRTIHLGCDPARFSGDEPASAGAGFAVPPGPFAFYPANFWPHKNHDLLLLGFHRFARAHPGSDLRLVLAGAPLGRAEEVERLARHLGLGARVDVLGYVGDALMPRLFRRACFLILPSLFEGFGIPLTEAMAAGCPIAASDCTSLPEVGGDAALYFDPRSPDAIAGAIADLASKPALRADLAARGRERVKRFTIRAMAAAYRDVFRDARAAGAAAAAGNGAGREVASADGLHEDGWTSSHVCCWVRTFRPWRRVVVAGSARRPDLVRPRLSLLVDGRRARSLRAPPGDFEVVAEMAGAPPPRRIELLVVPPFLASDYDRADPRRLGVKVTRFALEDGNGGRLSLLG